MGTTYHNVKTFHIMLASTMSALISAGAVAGFILYKDQQDLPKVEVDPSGKCVQVLNYKNGDAYNCQDVDVLLRKYRKAPSVESAESPAPVSDASVSPTDAPHGHK